MGRTEHILVVDLEPELTSAIREFTQLESRVFANAEALSAAAADLSPLAVFVGLRQQDVFHGVCHIPWIRSKWPQTAIFVLAPDPEVQRVGHALAEGADDFIRLPLIQDELLVRFKARLGAIAEKGASEFVEFGSGRLNLKRRYIEGPNGVTHLSPLQSELLQIMVRNDGGLMSKKDLKKEVWGQISVSDNALDRRLSELRGILRDCGCGMFIVSEYGKGVSLQYRGPRIAGRFAA